MGCVVEDEVGGEKLVIGDLVAGGVVASEGELEEKTTKASTWK